MEHRTPAVLCVDPAMRNTGLLVLTLDTDAGRPVYARVLVTKNEAKKRHAYQVDDDGRCILELRTALIDVCRLFNVRLFIVEAPPASAKGTRAVKALAYAYATAVCAAAELTGAPPIIVTPYESQSKAAGGKRPDTGMGKAVIKAACLATWGAAIETLVELIAAKKQEHVYDAGGAAIAAWNHPLVSGLRSVARAQAGISLAEGQAA